MLLRVLVHGSLVVPRLLKVIATRAQWTVVRRTRPVNGRCQEYGLNQDGNPYPEMRAKSSADEVAKGTPSQSCQIEAMSLEKPDSWEAGLCVKLFNWLNQQGESMGEE